MTVKLTTLMENSKKEGSPYETEHGLAILIETDQGSLLMDTGQTDLLMNNAKLMGAALEDVDHIVLSHAHYDHTGGLEAVANQAVKSPHLWVSKHFFERKFKKVEEELTYIGAPFNKEDLGKMNLTLHTIEHGIHEIMPEVFLVSGFERIDPFETLNPRFYVFKNTAYEPDYFADETAVVVKTDKGLVVAFGCGHPGSINMLTKIVNHFDEPIRLLLGGTHLVRSSEERILHTIEQLNRWSVERVGVSHCTGETASGLMADRLGERYFNNCTGTVIRLD